jgi:hypothetical protein
MSMLDRLRESALQEEELYEDADQALVEEEAVREQRVLGMNAVERMLLAIMVFLATSVLGTLLLIALGRIDIGL